MIAPVVSKRSRVGFEVKKRLLKVFPNNKFFCREEVYSLGSTIHIRTDLVRDLSSEEYNERRCLRDKLGNEGLDVVEHDRLLFLDSVLVVRREIEGRIKCLISDFWHVDYDESGEILGGGNTYVSIAPLEVQS